MVQRRRNRLNGRIAHVGDGGFSVAVDQSFGNCPQYIQHRKLEFIESDPSKAAIGENVIPLTRLDPAASAMITTADTFFVSSYVEAQDKPEIEGVDVSHRGGRPGFVSVDEQTLTIPDYSGNLYFNTLGNFLMNPKAGLIFIDFTTGELLMLTGTVTLLWEGDPTVLALEGAERAWQFTLHHGVRLKNALPFRSDLNDGSSIWMDHNSSTANSPKNSKQWRPYRLVNVVDDSLDIRSFYFKSLDDSGVPPFKAGQFITVRVMLPETKECVTRTYSLSSAPSDTYYRISVKREIDGKVSSYFHDVLKIGDILELQPPRGDFFINPLSSRPAVLIAAGVGVTPILSMAAHMANESQRTRQTRSVTIFHAAKNTQQRAFSHTFRTLEEQAEGNIRYYSFVSQADKENYSSADIDGVGRIDRGVLRQRLVLDDYEFYLCGPSSFMQAMYNILLSLGVHDSSIFAEAFGPAVIQRQIDASLVVDHVMGEADAATLSFSRSGLDQAWHAGDATILDVAESYGLNPASSCRSGSCGSCAVTLTSGSVTYRQTPTAEYRPDEVLICCAVPAKGCTFVEVNL